MEEEERCPCSSSTASLGLLLRPGVSVDPQDKELVGKGGCGLSLFQVVAGCGGGQFFWNTRAHALTRLASKLAELGVELLFWFLVVRSFQTQRPKLVSPIRGQTDAQAILCFLVRSQHLDLLSSTEKFPGGPSVLSTWWPSRP